MTSVGLRSCATKERCSSHRNCVHQLRHRCLLLDGIPSIAFHTLAAAFTEV